MKSQKPLAWNMFRATGRFDQCWHSVDSHVAWHPHTFHRGQFELGFLCGHDISFEVSVRGELLSNGMQVSGAPYPIPCTPYSILQSPYSQPHTPFSILYAPISIPHTPFPYSPGGSGYKYPGRSLSSHHFWRELSIVLQSKLTAGVPLGMYNYI